MEKQPESSRKQLVTRSVWQKIKLLLAGAMIGGIAYAMVSKYFL